VATHPSRRGGSPADREGGSPADARVAPIRDTEGDTEPQRPLRERVADDVPLAVGDWRTVVAGASGLNVLAGVWLILAPFVLAYGDGDPVWNDVIFGAATAIIALVRVSGAYRSAWLSWVNALIGAWIVLSAFVLDETSTASSNDVIVGVLIVVIALVSISATDEGRRERHLSRG